MLWGRRVAGRTGCEADELRGGCAEGRTICGADELRVAMRGGKTWTVQAAELKCCEIDNLRGGRAGLRGTKTKVLIVEFQPTPSMCSSYT